MACEQWRGKLDLYLDGELAEEEAGELAAHLRGCASCAGDVLDRVQLKRAVKIAGKRYEPSAALRSRIARGARVESGSLGWRWRLAGVAALILLAAAAAANFYAGRERAARQRVYSELADLHVATLASATPVDVVSSDRHTVKPWFQGRIPFTFNLPELQGSEFTLVGGRVTYLEQTPGAHLIYQIRKHQISVFIFQERGGLPGFAGSVVNALSFNVESWTQNGLRYFAVGDASADDIRGLSRLLKSAR